MHPQSCDTPKKKEIERFQKACKDFESIFVSKVLKSMRNSITESGLFGEGFGSDVYQSLFDSQLSEKISDGGGFGVGNVLYKSLAERLQLDTDQSVGGNGISLQNMVTGTNVEYKENLFNKIQHYDDIIKEAGDKFQCPAHLVYGVIAQESAGDTNAVSKAGAKGLMQLMDETASDLGVKNSFDPGQNIHAGVRYLRQQLDDFDGNIKLALAAYNAGPGNVKKYNGIPPFKETQDYIKKVLDYADDFADQFKKNSKSI